MRTSTLRQVPAADLPPPEERADVLEPHRHGPGCNHDHSPADLKIRLTFVFAGTVCLLLCGLWRWLRPEQTEIAALWSMAACALTAAPIVRDTLAGVRSKAAENSEFYMNQFITLAVLACFVSGQYATGAIVGIILLIGHLLEDRTMLGASQAIENLLSLTRAKARRIDGEREEEIDAVLLLEGDLIRVRPGDIIPADGVIEDGASTIDQANITGESIPIDAALGTKVFAGTLNLTGVLKIRVSEMGENTVIGRVHQIVEEAQTTRAPIIRLTEEYARYYLPLILLVAGFVLFFTRDLQRAISVFIVAIPCTFVMAGPTAMVAALASASRLGILIKSVRFFEAANDVDTVVFDKTGTLTTGQLEIESIHTAEGWSERDVLACAAAVEQYSTHPVARAILRAAELQQLLLASGVDLEEAHGLGVRGRADGRAVIVGRAAFLEQHGIVLPSERVLTESIGSELFVAVDGRFAGRISLADTVRAESAEVLQRLYAQGLDHSLMLTGDRVEVATRIAAQVGITQFEAGCLPEQKLRKVEALKAAGHHVLVVGDGVNDAPALAAGHLSMAMGALGSEVAIQTADIALMSTDLRRVSDFVELASRTLRVINQNMLCGLLFVALAITLSGLGLIPPIAAALLHEAGAFFVILNSGRLLRFEGTRNAS